MKLSQPLRKCILRVCFTIHSSGFLLDNALYINRVDKYILFPREEGGNREIKKRGNKTRFLFFSSLFYERLFFVESDSYFYCETVWFGLVLIRFVGQILIGWTWN